MAKNLVKTVAPDEQFNQNQYWKESLFKGVKEQFFPVKSSNSFTFNGMSWLNKKQNSMKIKKSDVN